MEDGLCDRVKLFTDIEQNCSEIYSLLIGLCPEKTRLWEYLSKVEENHASISALAGRYCALGKLPDTFMHPSLSLADLKETLELALDLKNKIRDSDISFEEALEKVLLLEDAACKVYFRDFLNSDTDSESETISRLRELAWDTDAHIQILKDLATKRKHY